MIAAALLAVPTVASAQPKPAAAGAIKIVLAPVSTLGSEGTSKATARVQKVLEAGLITIPKHSLVSARDLKRAVRKARKPELRTCDGDATCLASLGTLLHANLVVYAELGGLGDAQVVYLKLIDPAAGKEVRSTTLEIGTTGNAAENARAASYRLLAPAKYVGTLVTKVDVKGASIFVDGKRVAKSPGQAKPMPVGTHALRVTHPEFRDFVRFVDIKFDTAETVEVSLQQYPVIRSDIKSRPGPMDGNVVYRGVERTPWYKQWYTIAGAGTVVFIGSAVLFGVIADGIDADRVKTVGGP